MESASRHTGLVLVAFLAMVLALELDSEVSFPVNFSSTSGKLGEEKWVFKSCRELESRCGLWCAREERGNGLSNQDLGKLRSLLSSNLGNRISTH